MEEQLISRDCSPPSVAINSSVSGAKGCRLLRTRSAPSNTLAWLLTASRTLAPKEVMATNAATPKVMAEMASSSLFLLPRLSRQAILQSQLMLIGASRFQPSVFRVGLPESGNGRMGEWGSQKLFF